MPTECYEGCENDLFFVSGVFSFDTAHTPDQEFNNPFNYHIPPFTIRSSTIQLQRCRQPPKRRICFDTENGRHEKKIPPY